MVSSFKSPNAIHVLKLLVRNLNVRVSSFTITNELLNHPDYPSLLSLGDCLTSWKLPNIAYKIDKDDYRIEEELPRPAIVHLKTEGGQFILVREVKDGKVIFSSERETRGVLSEAEFLKGWDGIILYAEKDTNSGEQHYNQSVIKGLLNRSRLPFLVSVFLISAIYTINISSVMVPYLLLLIFKLAGITVGALLLLHSVDVNNPFIQNLCSIGKKNGCNDILRSEAARVSSWLSWSEVGMFYFAGSFLVLLLNPEHMAIMAWLNILCLPYTVYSIGFQIKTKNWCVLCCFVQVILWLEAITWYTSGQSFQVHVSDINLMAITGYLLCFLVPIAIWSFLKPYLLNAGLIQPLKQQLKIFKYNSSLFNSLLSSQQHYTIPDNLMPVILGNPAAGNIITVVSNPFCGPCATAHKKLDDLLSQHDDLQLKILFATASQDTDDGTLMARHATGLSKQANHADTQHALNDWYSQPHINYEDWAEKYPVTSDHEMTVAVERQKEWCEMAEISFTPTILVNGYKLIDPYQLDDIKYLLG